MSNNQEQQDIQFYVDRIGTSEIHSFFTQAIKSRNHGLFLAASLCYIAGIEASIRGALARINELSFDDNYGSTLSNQLLRSAHEYGLPIDALSMSSDANFHQAIQQKKPNVRLVEVRHALAHGNLLDFVNREYSFFTVDVLEDLTSELEVISKNWISKLSESPSNPFYSPAPLKNSS